MTRHNPIPFYTCKHYFLQARFLISSLEVVEEFPGPEHPKRILQTDQCEFVPSSPSSFDMRSSTKRELPPPLFSNISTFVQAHAVTPCPLSIPKHLPPQYNTPSPNL